MTTFSLIVYTCAHFRKLTPSITTAEKQMNAQNGIHSDWSSMDQWKSSSADRKSWFRQWEEMVPPTRRDGSADEKTWFCWWEDSLSEDVAALQWCMIRWIKMWTMKWLLSRRWMWRRGYRRRPVASVIFWPGTWKSGLVPLWGWVCWISTADTGGCLASTS